MNNATLKQITLEEIKRKALAGEQMQKPDATKNALYDYYKANPNAQITGSLNDFTINEIQRKAQSGITMDSPTGEKDAIYNAFKANSTTQQPSPITPAPITPTPITPSPTPTGPAPLRAPTDNGRDNWNSNQSIPDFMGMTPEMIQKALGMSTEGSQYYDPEQDPVYKSMLELSQKQADKAGLNAMELMNERGILNSTVTADRIGQIKQGASDAVLGAIPGLANAFNNKQANNSQSVQNLLNSVLGAGQFQQSFAEDNRRFDKGFSLDEAKVSGRYVSPEAEQALQALFDAKDANERGGITAEERAANSRKADESRRLLASLGYDVTGLASNIGLDRAQQNSANVLGRDSLPQQEMDLSKTEVMGSQQDKVAQGLIDTILKSKEANERGGISAAQRQSNSNAANAARSQLSALGFDVSKLDSNVGLSKATQNISGMGQATLKALSEQANQQHNKDKLAFEKDAFGREMDFKEGSFGREMDFKEGSFDREMNYKEQVAMIDADLKARGLDIDEARVSISRFTAQSDAEYKQFQMDNGISEQNASKNTNMAIGEVMKSRSAAEAIEFISDSASSWAKQGVDIREVMKAIDQRFPGASEAVSGSGGDSGGRYGTAVP